MFSGNLFRLDSLSIFVGIFVGIFSLLILLYSVGFMRQKKGVLSYYLYVLLTLIASLGAVFSNNLIVFMVFWGFLALTLFLLIGLGDKKRTQSTAKKTLPLGLASVSIQAQYKTDFGLMFAGLVIVLIPTLLVYILLQRQLTKGITLGALKG